MNYLSMNLEVISGGFDLGETMSAIGSYVALNGSAGVATYAWSNVLSGNQISAAGVAGGAVGGLVGGIKKLPAAAVVGGFTGNAAEGILNGRGLIPTLFSQYQQNLDNAIEMATS